MYTIQMLSHIFKKTLPYTYVYILISHYFLESLSKREIVVYG